MNSSVFQTLGGGFKIFSFFFHVQKITHLGGGFKHFRLFTPDPWGDDPIWLALIFFKWVVQPPTRHFLNFLFCRCFFWGDEPSKILWSETSAFWLSKISLNKKPTLTKPPTLSAWPLPFSMAGNATITLFQAHRRDRFTSWKPEHFETSFGGWFAFSRSLGSLFIFRGG